MSMDTQVVPRPSTRLRTIGFVTAAVGPLTGGLLTLVALVIAVNLLRRGQRTEAIAVALVAVTAMALLLLFVTPVNTGTQFFRG
jgi:hypothetical protein